MEFRDTGQNNRALVLLVVIACILQVGFVPQVSILGGRFNAMLALAGSFALMGNTRRAVYAGFFAGLFYDLTASVPIGLMTLLLTIASFALSHASGAGTSGFSTSMLRLFFLYALSVSLANGIALMCLGLEGSLLVSLGSHGLVSALLTTLIAAPFLLVTLSSSQGGSGFSARGGSKGARYKTTPGRKRTRSLR